MITIKGQGTKQTTFELELKQSGNTLTLYCTTKNVPDSVSPYLENSRWSIGYFTEKAGRLSFSKDPCLNSSLFRTDDGGTIV